MRSYPVNLNVRGRLCLVVGGGGVGTRKALQLLRCGAEVVVISPLVSDALRPLIDEGALRWRARGYRQGDLASESPSAAPTVFLVITATDDPAVNAEVHAEAKRSGILCNIADRPEACDFTLPAVVSRGDLSVAISTSGKSPALARRLRKDLEKQLGEEYDIGLKLMGAARKKLLGEGYDPEAHKARFRKVIDGGLIAMIRDGRFAELDGLLADALGESYTFESLMKAV